MSIKRTVRFRPLAMALTSLAMLGVGVAARAQDLTVNRHAALGGPFIQGYANDISATNNVLVQGPESMVQGGGRGRLRVGSAWGYSGIYTDVTSTGAPNDLVLGASSGLVRVGLSDPIASP